MSDNKFHEIFRKVLCGEWESLKTKFPMKLFKGPTILFGLEPDLEEAAAWLTRKWVEQGFSVRFISTHEPLAIRLYQAGCEAYVADPLYFPRLRDRAFSETSRRILRAAVKGADIVLFWWEDLDDPKRDDFYNTLDLKAELNFLEDDDERSYVILKEHSLNFASDEMILNPGKYYWDVFYWELYEYIFMYQMFVAKRLSDGRLAIAQLKTDPPLEIEPEVCVLTDADLRGNDGGSCSSEP